jgi:Chitobiase/beta-hexosaminidase C-terminal domain/Putative metal-binding motif/Secretion system C-terminal sorting domain/Fn3 associated/PQQ-like domain
VKNLILRHFTFVFAHSIHWKEEFYGREAASIQRKKTGFINFFRMKNIFNTTAGKGLILSGIIFCFSLFPVWGQNTAEIMTYDWKLNGAVNSMVKEGNNIYMVGDFDYIGPARTDSNGTVLNVSDGLPNISDLHPDGEVLAAIPDGSGGWYIGGRFQHIGSTIRRGLARINQDGSLNAWNPGDGSGVGDGWVNALAIYNNGLYNLLCIGGVFSSLANAASTRSNIGAIDLSTNGLDPNFNPVGATNGAISELLFSNNQVFVAGNFSMIGGLDRTGLASLDMVNGHTNSWNPVLEYCVGCSDGNAEDLAAANGILYVGGNFNTINGIDRTNLAAFDLSDLSNAASGLLSSWNTASNIQVHDIIANGTEVYVGGAGVKNLSKFDPTTGALIGEWATDEIGVLALGVGKLYIATTNKSILTLDLSSNLISGWSTTFDGSVSALAVNGNKLYVGGSFSSIGGKSLVSQGGADNLIAIDATTGMPANWSPYLGELVFGQSYLASGGGNLYVSFKAGQGNAAAVAAFDLITGEAKWYRYLADGSINSMAYKNGKLYVGGRFAIYNIFPELINLVALEGTTGNPITTWHPNPNGEVGVLKVINNLLIVGGGHKNLLPNPQIWAVGFSTIAGETRLNLASFDLSTGMLLDWNPGVTWDAGTAAYEGNSNTAFAGIQSIEGEYYSNGDYYGGIYIGGYFNTVNGQPRNCLADLYNPANTGFNPSGPLIGNLNPFASIFGGVKALALGTYTLYVGGIFDQIGGKQRKNLAAISLIDPVGPTNWNPNVSQENQAQLNSFTSVNSIVFNNCNVFIGGNFNNVGGNQVSYFGDVKYKPLALYRDSDNDGYGNPADFITTSCEPEASYIGFVLNSEDCNDSDPAEYNSTWFLDADSDGFGDESNLVSSCSKPGSQYVRNKRDCDDSNPAINPRVFETSGDGIDNDCDGFTDEGADPPGTTYCDIDGDGFGDPGCPIPPGGLLKPKNGIMVMLSPGDGVPNNTDCNDSDPAINPLAFEGADGKDNDCNGASDETTLPVQITWYLDEDNDGYGAAIMITSVYPGVGWSMSEPAGGFGDCNDSESSVHPGSTEICGNGIDENCNGMADDICSGNLFTYYRDLDGDNFGNSADTIRSAASTVPVGYSATGGDCNDGNAAINPGTSEVCNGIDDNCDGQADEGLSTTAYYPDADGDGFGAASAPAQFSCTPLNGYVANNTDCDDNNSTFSAAFSFYADNDGDGFGAGPLLSGICAANASAPPSGYAGNNTDCNDNNSTFSGVFSFYADNDGDGFGSGPLLSGICAANASAPPSGYAGNNTDCAPADNTKWQSVLLFVDNDNDGYDASSSLVCYGAALPAGYKTSTMGRDCNDNNPTINPGAAEICGNGKDDNCNGQTDENNPVVSAGANVALIQNSGNIQLSGSPTGGTWSGTGVSAGGIFSSSGSIGQYKLTYCFTNAQNCTKCDSLTASITSGIPVQVATPVISPGTGSYSSSQLVSISCSTPGAQIYYTTTGNTPVVGTTFTKLYTAPFQIISTTNVKAIGVLSGSDNSAVASSLLTILNPAIVSAPVITPGTGTVSGPVSVSITCATADATIYYTTSGNTPVVGTTFTKLYSGPFSVIETSTVKAMAVQSGLSNSSVVVSIITMLESGIVKNPVITPGSGTFDGSVAVSISTLTPDAQIYYTTSGNTPVIGTGFTRLYTGPFTLIGTTTVRAMAIKSGLANSGVTVANLVVNAPSVVAAPTFSPAPGTYPSRILVSISSATDGAQIYVTNNGITPSNTTLAARLYSTPLNVGSSGPIKAIAYKAGFLTSPVSVGSYVIGAARVSTDGEGEEPFYYQQTEPGDLQDNTDVDVIPNPSNGRFRITTSQPMKDAHIHIYNMLGQLVSKSDAVHDQLSVDVDISQQPTGFYTVVLIDGHDRKVLRVTKE